MAQKSYWATPRLGPAAQVMLTWEGEHSSGPKRGKLSHLPGGLKSSRCDAQGCMDGWK